jgi:N-[(2S)-2-amino-2-carboxyethyl]-L-glutamate dehydrogenase
MTNQDILILKAEEVHSILAGRELEIIQRVREAYESHTRRESSLPHSVFLRLLDNERNRIIGLPAYLGGQINACGVKWVSSFPQNIEQGLDRASAVIVLNSVHTGRPEAVLEGSIISAKRTAASAAVAAQYLHSARQTNKAGFVGCGLINFEIARFLLAVFPNLKELFIYDLDPARANRFKQLCESTFEGISLERSANINSLFRSCSLVSFATTANVPHITHAPELSPDHTILHISLRDLSPEIILSCDNIVDDVDHVLRAQTSVHLAEQLAGHRDFIRCTLGEIINGAAPSRRGNSAAVFSPFGLGILDVALAMTVRDTGLRQGKGTVIRSFLPGSWDAEA